MIITEYEHWLVVRQSRRRRIYRVTLVATVSRTLRTPLGARARKRGGFMQLRWFHIRGVCIAPGCVYRSSSARRDMGIPGDRIKRVETYHHCRVALRRASACRGGTRTDLRMPRCTMVRAAPAIAHASHQHAADLEATLISGMFLHPDRPPRPTTSTILDRDDSPDTRTRHWPPLPPPHLILN